MLLVPATSAVSIFIFIEKYLGKCWFVFCKIYVIVLLKICVELFILLITSDFVMKRNFAK